MMIWVSADFSPISGTKKMRKGLKECMTMTITINKATEVLLVSGRTIAIMATITDTTTKITITDTTTKITITDTTMEDTTHIRIIMGIIITTMEVTLQANGEPEIPEKEF